ncbi:DUF6538 domain-containing protein [Brevundimonas sp.]|uniref:DUF6538 domain-containing protein n=1 Tax=Brevundimonas sp. TaxID=1871086 RepID=UPI0028A14DB1|nr:DUF6538 domain-containing protein [Brevundimonas sp.]
MPTYLTKRGATYYFRRVIPEDLRPAFDGKRELTFSLRTKDRHEAAKRCRIEAVKSDKLFEQAESSPSSALSSEASGSSAVKPVLEGEVLSHAAIVLESYRRRRDRYADEGRLAEFNSDVRETLRHQESSIAHGPMPMEGETMADALRRAEAMKMGIVALLTGEGAAVLSERFLAERKERPVSKPNALMLPDLVVKWAAEKQPTAKSVDMWNRTCGVFYSVNGEKPVSAITKADVLAFKDHLISEGKAPATIDSRLNHLRSLFRFAVENDIISTDPAANVKAPPAKRAKEARLPYSEEALRSVFNSPIYSKGERPNRGAGEVAYWLPLLALYTGARLGELGQLRPRDIVQEVYQDADGKRCKAWVIRIVEDKHEGLTLKNVGSNRRVPVHQALIDLGLP